jgi:hypothetical protein
MSHKLTKYQIDRIIKKISQNYLVDSKLVRHVLAHKALFYI